jgi:hypothetical protein
VQETRSVVVEHSLGPLEVVPIDVPLVVVGNQHHPFLDGLARPDLLENPVADAGAHFGTAVAVAAGVRRLGQEAHDRAIGWSLPPHLELPRDAPTLRRHVQTLLQQPHQRLTGAAQFEEFLEDQADGPLHPCVGIFLEPLVGRLEEAHGSFDDQLSSLRLGHAGLQGALPEQVVRTLS